MKQQEENTSQDLRTYGRTAQSIRRSLIDPQGLKRGISIGLGIILTLATSALIAVSVTGTINSFTSGGVVDAAQINTNFDSLKTAIQGITSSQWTTSGSNIYYNAGNVGIGTASPGSDGTASRTQLSFGGFGAIWVNNDSSNPFGIDTVSGKLRIFAGVVSNTYQTQIGSMATGNVFTPFITVGDGTSNRGNVGIGTTSPSALLHVAGTAGNNTGTWSNLSDERLKKNITDYKGSLEKLQNLRPVSFEWKENKEGRTAGRHIGFIAQEVEKVFPEWISAMSDGNKWMTPEGMNAVLVGAIRELKSLYDHEKQETVRKDALNASLAKENASLKEQVSRMDQRLRAIETALAGNAGKR